MPVPFVASELSRLFPASRGAVRGECRHSSVHVVGVHFLFVLCLFAPQVFQWKDFFSKRGGNVLSKDELPADFYRIYGLVEQVSFQNRSVVFEKAALR